MSDSEEVLTALICFDRKRPYVGELILQNSGSLRL